jgi:hypothetical protein
MEKGTKRRVLGSRYLLFSIAAFYALSSNISSVDAGTSLPSFSADVTHTVDKQTSTGKIYATRNAVRTEIERVVKGQEVITIVRLDRNELHVLAPAQATNVEMPYINDTGTSEAEFVIYMEGAETQRASIGADQIGAYHCEKSRVQVTYQGHVYSSIEWAAKELDGFVVKRAGEQGEWSSEYSNVRLGPQDSSLFEIPAAYKTIKYSKNWMALLQKAMLPGNNPSQLVTTARAAGLKVIGDDPTLFSRSHPMTDYSFTLIDPVTGAEVYSVHSIVDSFPRSPPESVPESKPVEPQVVSVLESDSGSDYLLDVSFVVPDVPEDTFDTITVYGVRFVGSQRSHDKSYPSIRGHWQPKDHVEFSVRVPKERADPSEGWNLTFCVGSAASCYPSANLLTLISKKTK